MDFDDDDDDDKALSVIVNQTTDAAISVSLGLL